MVDPISLGALVFSIAGAYTGGLIWGIRLEGKVRGHDQLFVERKDLNTVQYDALKASVAEVNAKVDRLIDHQLSRRFEHGSTD